LAFAAVGFVAFAAFDLGSSVTPVTDAIAAREYRIEY
jgi:hypothetical protein